MSAIPPLTRERFRVAGCTADPARNTLSRADRYISVEPRVMDVLCALAERPGAVRLRHEILDRVWGTSGGTDDTLSRAISILRRAFKDLGETGVVIETAARRGYCLVPEVEVIIEAPSELPQAPGPDTASTADPAPADVRPTTTAEVVAAKRKIRSKPMLLAGLAIVLTAGAATALLTIQSQDQGRSPDVAVSIPDDGAAPSIAVLPFRDFSPEQDQRWFAEGIADGLLNDLARTDGLRVASRTSAFSFTDDRTPIADVAQALGVRHVLEGSVQKSGDTFRVTAQLIDADTDAHIWSNVYERELSPDALFAMQDDIREEIVTQLVGRLQTPANAGAPTQSQMALEAFLKGRAAYQSSDRESLDLAIAELNRAVDIDPLFARAHAELARVHRLRGQMGYVPATRADALADISLERAVELAPDDPSVLTAKAWVQEGRVPPSEVLPIFEAALAANPADGEAYRGRARSLMMLGEYDRALADFQTAVEIDPRSTAAWASLARELGRAGRVGDRNEALLRLLELDPDHMVPLQMLASDAYGIGELPLAHRIHQQLGETMRAQLNGIYLETNLRQYIVDPSPDLRADMAFADGDYDAALAIAYEPEATPTTRIRALYHADKLSDVVPVWQGSNVFAERYFPIFDDREKLREAIKHDNAFTSIVMGMKGMGDPEWEKRSTQLVDAYGDAQNLSSNWDYSKAIALATHGDIEGAMRSAELFLARGTGKLVADVDPGFAPLRDDPRWARLVAMNEAKRQEHRAAIVADLADPPEVWFSLEDTRRALQSKARP